MFDTKIKLLSVLGIGELTFQQNTQPTIFGSENRNYASAEQENIRSGCHDNMGLIMLGTFVKRKE